MKLFRSLRPKVKTDEHKRLLMNDSLEATELRVFNDALDNHNRSSAFQDFSDELLLILLLHLDIKSLGKISSVSKHFNRLSLDPVFLYALFCRDFPSVWPDRCNILSAYKTLYHSMKNPNFKLIYEAPTCALLNMHGNDINDWVKPKKLTIHTLLTKIDHRPLIRLFSRQQPQLNLIYDWLKSNKIVKLLRPAYLLRLSVLCNQHYGFEQRFAHAIATTAQPDVDKLMYLAVLLGYDRIILSLYALQPTIDLNKTTDGLTYSEIALIENNSEALDALLNAGAYLPQNQPCIDLAIKRNNRASLDIMSEHVCKRYGCVL